VSIAHTDVRLSFFDDFPYPKEVSPEDRATLGSDPSADGTSGEEEEANENYQNF